MNGIETGTEPIEVHVTIVAELCDDDPVGLVDLGFQAGDRGPRVRVLCDETLSDASSSCLAEFPSAAGPLDRCRLLAAALRRAADELETRGVRHLSPSDVPRKRGRPRKDGGKTQGPTASERIVNLACGRPADASPNDSVADPLTGDPR